MAARDPESEISDERGNPPVVLTIAGFDPSSGAGITADLKVFAAFGTYGTACVTALTVQSTVGVRAVEPVARNTVAATLQMLTDDVVIAGIKLGMLATAEVCEVVSEFLELRPDIPVVLDPVMRSSSGRELLEPKGVRLLRERLLGQVTWVTPNLDELAVLTDSTVLGRESVPESAEGLRDIAQKQGSRGLNILVTGGHLHSPDDYLLPATGSGHWIPGERVRTNATHGTGCAHSSALLCGVVKGDDPLTAATRAKEYVTAALKAAYPVGRGKGPMNHLFAMDHLLA
jgi:hydroxymethylpyrimidine/phosphomethylpyrimidine kinase